METFIAVVECGSFTGAASRLGLSAVMVGKYIAQLESQLATRLLERNTRRQSLTDAGRVYFDEAKRVMEQVSIAESAVERLRLAPAGTLRVSAPTSFGASVIAPLTATFLQVWPAVRVELDLTNRMVDLVDEGFGSGDPYRRDPSGGSGGSLPGAVSDGDLRRAGLSGALRDPRDARGSRRSSLPVPYGLDRPQRVAAAGRRGRSALETRCGFALQRWLRAAPGGDRRGRAADAAGGTAGRCAGQRQPGARAG
ncbi:LysR family transcriptional regulator, partial [Klebsiella pneumoniae subsp. pneumoniae KpMDU1]